MVEVGNCNCANVYHGHKMKAIKKRHTKNPTQENSVKLLYLTTQQLYKNLLTKGANRIIISERNWEHRLTLRQKMSTGHKKGCNINSKAL